MPRTRSLAWAELKIGIVAVAAMVLAAMIIVAVGGAGGFSWQRYELKTKFPDVKGLKSGAVVRVAGVEVGKVTGVALSGAEVEVLLEVKKGNEQRITTDSRASIGSLSLLGEPVIDISPTTTGTPLKDGDYIPAGRAPGQLADVADGARESLEQMTAMLKDIRAGKGTVGKLFSDDELYKEITAFVTAAQGVTTHLREGRGTFGRLLKDPAAYDRLNASLGDLQEITPADQCRRGQPRPLPQGRCARQVADRRVGQPRGRDRPAPAQRQHDGQAPDRKGALRPLQLGGRPRGRAGVGHPEVGRHAAAGAARQSSCMRTLTPLPPRRAR